MTPLSLRRSGEALRAAAGDLARVWRASRYPSAIVFPGLLDSIIEELLERVAEALLLEQPPAEVWCSLHGVIRTIPGEDGPDLLAEEWRLAADVLLSACEALEVAPEAARGIREAVAAGVAGIPSLLAGSGPEGVVLVRQLGGFRRRGEARTDAPP